MANTVFVEKLKNAFSEMVVYKDLKKSNFFSAISLPSFMRDYLFKKFQNDEGEFDMEEMRDFIDTYLPRKEEWIKIKDRIMTDNERVKLLTRISVDIDISTQKTYFELPDFGLSKRQTIITPGIWAEYREELTAGQEVWGVVEIGYYPPNGDDKDGKIMLTSFKNFCPYTVDLEYYKDMRNEFTLDEWIDLILGAIDYNAAGYAERKYKLSMIKRLLSFVEKRLNLIELAPKGTGKSYLFGRLSRFGYLLAGGTISRAKLFYDKAKRTQGIVFHNDFLGIDEIQTVSCNDYGDMRSVLKTYMEDGVYRGDAWSGSSFAGIVLLGNIDKEEMDKYGNLFANLPVLFKESALLDRFHGFIEGWDIPRMNEELKICGFALNSEYFTSIMHQLREDFTYRGIVDYLVELPDTPADTRDTEAVKRIATGYLKLLFPNVRRPEDITPHDFNQYCLKPAVGMRKIVLYQIGQLDSEYRGKNMPKFSVKGMS
ncbi:MAG: BREX system Lon protease-like protein BrxL [Christensenellaceae bacterium]|jgi:ATP-dependent Lon protease|nr:BREX system Lon protease-like protein BrxL [Christensenellaceae bacterium]